MDKAEFLEKMNKFSFEIQDHEVKRLIDYAIKNKITYSEAFPELLTFLKKNEKYHLILEQFSNSIIPQANDLLLDLIKKKNNLKLRFLALKAVSLLEPKLILTFYKDHLVDDELFFYNLEILDENDPNIYLLLKIIIYCNLEKDLVDNIYLTIETIFYGNQNRQLNYDLIVPLLGSFMLYDKKYWGYDSSPRFSESIANILGEMNDSRALPYLMMLYDDANFLKREEQSYDVSQDQYTEVRLAAIKSIIELYEPSANKTLIDAIRDAYDEVFLLAIEACGRLKIFEAKADLLRIIYGVYGDDVTSYHDEIRASLRSLDVRLDILPVELVYGLHYTGAGIYSLNIKEKLLPILSTYEILLWIKEFIKTVDEESFFDALANEEILTIFHYYKINDLLKTVKDFLPDENSRKTLSKLLLNLEKFSANL